MSVHVSVVMPAYNASPTLIASAESVLAQSFADLELVIVDDASSDATLELAQELAHRDGRVRIVRHHLNGGVARARNSALEASTGAYVAFLDSDDLWLPDKLQVQLAEMSGDVGFSYMAYQHLNSFGTLGSTWLPPASVTYAQALRGNPIGTLTAMISVDLLDGHRFPERGHEDYALWLTLLRKIPMARRVGKPQPYALYRTASTSLSGSKLRAMRWQWDVYRQQERLGALRAATYLSVYAVRGINKHFLSVRSAP